MSTETCKKTSFYFSSIRGVKESVSRREGELQTNKTQRDKGAGGGREKETVVLREASPARSFSPKISERLPDRVRGRWGDN